MKWKEKINFCCNFQLVGMRCTIRKQPLPARITIEADMRWTTTPDWDVSQDVRGTPKILFSGLAHRWYSPTMLRRKMLNMFHTPSRTNSKPWEWSLQKRDSKPGNHRFQLSSSIHSTCFCFFFLGGGGPMEKVLWGEGVGILRSVSCLPSQGSSTMPPFQPLRRLLNGLGHFICWREL